MSDLRGRIRRGLKRRAERMLLCRLSASGNLFKIPFERATHAELREGAQMKRLRNDVSTGRIKSKRLDRLFGFAP
jgi:hypothetical protein